MAEVFVKSLNCRDISDQFTWGEDLIIAPILSNETDWQRSVYLPEDMFELESGKLIEQGRFDVDYLIPVYLRQNRPILRQMEVKQTISQTRKSPFTVVVGLTADAKMEKLLFWDNDDNVDFLENHYMLKFRMNKAANVWTFEFSADKTGDFDVPSVDQVQIYYPGDELPNTLVAYSSNGGSTVVDFVKTDNGFNIIGLLAAANKIGIANTWEGLTIGTSDGSKDNRIDCSNGDECPSPCLTDSNNEIDSALNVPTCYFPESFSLYKSSEPTLDGDKVEAVLTKINDDTFYYDSISEVKASVEIINNDIVRVRYVDAANDRYEVPVKYNDVTAERTVNTEKPKVSIENGQVKVARSSGEVIFDSSAGPLVFEDQFLQASSVLTSSYVYGIGETEHTSFRLNQTWYQQGLFARDNFVEIGANLWGVHPYFTNLEEAKDGSRNAHGILFLNSNMMDITTQPGKVTWRTTGGILDFYIMIGPSPAEVTKQYTSLIGRPVMVPYWSLGYQICRYDYPNLENMREVVEGVRSYGIPYDVQYGDIDYMDRQLDFTIDPISYPDLPAFVDKVRDEYQMRFVFILDPAISVNESRSNNPESEVDYPPYDRAMEKDVFIKRPNGDVGVGKVWPYLPGWRLEDFECQDAYGGECWDVNVDQYHAWTAFPDFFKPETTEWWTNEIKEMYNNLLPFDGLWIDMNEPASFTSGYNETCDFDSSFNTPKFVPNIKDRDHITSKTACLDSKQYYADGELTDTFNTHSVYGYSQGNVLKR